MKRSTPISVPLVGIISLLIACTSTQKTQSTTGLVTEQVDEEAQATSPSEAEFVFGAVTTTYESDGCNYLIILHDAEEGGDKFLLPIGLDEEFLTNGMELKFTWTPSRAPSGNCYIGKPAILANVRSL